MGFKTFLLVASLVSAITAVPTGPRTSQCASSKCDQPQKFFYELGRKYEYDYEVQTTTTVSNIDNEAANIKVKALVAVQPVSPCEFLLSLSQVTLDYSSQSETFAREVMKHPIRFAFHDGRVEHVCPSPDEAPWVVNFKKGILSSFQSSMSWKEKETTVMSETDVSGTCETTYTIKEASEPETILIERLKNPSECSHRPQIHQKLSSLGFSFDSLVGDIPIMDSRQECVQRITKDIISSVTCEEEQTFQPFKSRASGATTRTKTKLELKSIQTSSTPRLETFIARNDLLFETTNSENNPTMIAAQTILMSLESLSENGIKKEVPTLFSNLVSSLRSLTQAEIQTLNDSSHPRVRYFITDALPLVGTPASSGVFVNLILNGEVSDKERDVWISSLAFVKKPSLEMLTVVEPLLTNAIDNKALLGISSMIHNYCLTDALCQNKRIIQAIISNFESRLGISCRATSEEEKLNILYALKSLGNSGHFVNAANILNRCIIEDNPIEIRVAAIDAWRRVPCNKWNLENTEFLGTFSDRGQDNEIRIASYLALMRCPTQQLMNTLKEILTSEGVNHVSTFVWTHLTNLQESAAPEKQLIKNLIKEDFFQKKFSPESLKLSRNFESSFYLKEQEFGASVESNVIFSSKSILPRSTMLNLTIDLFGESINLFEVGGRIEGLESYIEKFFGPDGYYPEETIAAIINNLRKKEQKDDTILEPYLIEEEKDQASGSYYLKLFGNEMFYHNFKGIENSLPEMKFSDIFEVIRELASKGSVDFTRSYNLIDSDFTFPTIAGLPIKLQLNGKAVIGFKLDGTFNFEDLTSMIIEGKFHPSAAITLDASMSVDASVTKAGVKIASTMHSSTFVSGKAIIDRGNLVDFIIDVPEEKTEIFDIHNEFFLIEDGEDIAKNSPISKGQGCFGVEMLGMQLCSEIDSAPYFGIFGSRNIRFYLQKTDSHYQYAFKYSNRQNKIALLIDMPGSLNDKKWSVSLTRQNGQYELDFHLPALISGNGKLSYLFNDQKNEVEASLSTDKLGTYAANFHIEKVIEEEQLKKVAGQILLQFSRFEREIFKVKGKLTYEPDAKLLDVQLDQIGVIEPSFSAQFNLNKKSENSLSLNVKSSPFDLSLSGSLGQVNSKNGATLLGTYRLYNRSPKSFTTQLHYQNQPSSSEMMGSISLDIEDFDFKTDFNFEMKENSISAKLMGKYSHITWNIEQSFFCLLTEQISKFVMNHKSSIPTADWKGLLDYQILNTKDQFLMESSLKTSTIEKEKRIIWNYGKDFIIDSSLTTPKDSMFGKLKIERKQDSSYAWQIDVNMSDMIKKHSKGSYEQVLSKDGIYMKLDYNCSVETSMLPLTNYKFEWFVNANKSQLQIDMSLDANDQNSFFTVNGQKNYFKIESNLIKPFTAEAKITSGDKEKRFSIISKLDGTDFQVLGEIGLHKLQATFKYKEKEIKFLAQLKAGSIEVEAQLSPIQKFTLWGHYTTNRLDIGFETPIKGWEKQEIAVTYISNENSIQGQVQITFSNINYITFNIDFKNERDFSMISHIFNLKFTSIFENLKTIKFSLKTLLHRLEMSTKVEGQWNSKIIEGNLEATQQDDQSIFDITLKSPYTEDFSISFKLTMPPKELSGSFDIIYGTQKSKIFLKSSISDPSNLSIHLNCSSPFLPEILIDASMKSNDVSKTLEVRGNYNNKEILLIGKCEAFKTGEKHICKLDLELVIGSMNIFTGSYTHETGSENDFQIDITLSSLLLSGQSVKGHIGGKFASLASTVLTGYIFGPGDFTGRLDINHKIIKDKLLTEVNIEKNSSKISINLRGDIDLKSKECSLQGEMKSTQASMNGYKVVFQHQIQNKARETSIVLSKGNFNFYVYHSIFMKDVFNWINIFKINDNYSLRSENIKLDGFMKQITKIKLAEKTIDLTIEGSYRKKQLYLTMMLDTPWTSMIQVTAVHKKEGSKRQIEIKTEYADEKRFIINTEYEASKNSKQGSFKISNRDWNLIPLQIEFRLKSGVNTKFESTLQLNQHFKAILQLFRKEDTFGGNVNIKFNDKNYPMSLIGLWSQTSNGNRIYLEYNSQEKYAIDLTSSQDQPRKIIAKLTIPCLSPKSFTNSLTYDFTNYPFYLILESDFDEQVYYLETKVDERKGSLKTLAPSYNGSLSVEWQINEEEKSIHLDLKSPFQFIEDTVLDLNLKVHESKVLNIEFRYGTQWMHLKGEIREGFILLRTQSSAEQWKNLEVKVNFSHSEISGQVSKNNDIITFKGLVNLDLSKGEGIFHFSLPYYEFEKNKIIVEYSNANPMKNVKIYANIGSKIWDFKLLSKPIDISSMQVMVNIQTQQEFKNIVVETMIRPTSIKINGKIDGYHFESLIEFTAEKLEKTELTFHFISNIPYFELLSIQAHINMYQMPYKTFVEMKSGNETQTYSLTFDLRESNIAIEIQTPIKSLEIIKITGSNKIENKKLEAIFTCQTYTDSYTISGLIDVSQPIQKIEFNLILPPNTAVIKDIKLSANCTFENIPSLNFLLQVGEKIYKANINSKFNASEGNGFVSVILNDMVDLNVNISYNLLSPISHFLTEIEYNGILDKYYIQKRQTSNEFSLDIETPIKKFRKLFIAGQYSEMGITNIISGKIINNNDVYHFEGKVTQIKNGAEIQLSIPYDQYETQITPRNFREAEQQIKIFISYQCDDTNAFIKMITPFESLSYLAIGTRLENESNGGNRLIYIHRNSERTELSLSYKLLSSLMKLDLKASLNGPSSNRYALEVFYDFISQEKKGGFIVENGQTVIKYSAEMLYTGIDHGYIKVYTPYPNFKINGFEYKFKAQDISNIEAFISVIQDTEEIVFGVTSRYNPNEITFMLQTPFVNYKTFGLESQFCLEEKHGKLRLELGIYKFFIEGNLQLDNFGIHLETSAKNFKIFKFSSKYEWQSLKKSALLEFIYNDLKYELNGDITTSYRTPQISFKFISPLEFLSVLELTGKIDIIEPSEFLEINLKVNAIKYSLSFGYELQDLHGLIKLRAITPIPKWTSIGLDIKVDLSSEAKDLFISFKQENITKILSLSAKSLDDEVAFDLQLPFETAEHLKSHFFVKRNKRSVESNVMNDRSNIIQNFNSLKIVITSPFEKAKDIHFELIRNAKGITLSYKRNNNQIFMNFKVEKKGKSFDIKITSEIPGWELLALAGRLDANEILGYIRGQRNSDMVQISGSGKLGNKFGSISLTAKTPFENYKEVNTVLEYHFRRRTFRLESNSNSSKFHIMIKYQREWEVDIFVPNKQGNTQINGKLAWFKGNLTGQSRFSILRSFSLNYVFSIEQNIIKATIMIDRNGKKVFEHEFEFDVQKTKVHSMTHIRRGENHSMLHFHLDKWTKAEFIFKRNNKEFSVKLDGTSGLPMAGTITYTIMNSFREVPRKVYGTIEVDRNSSPKKITLLVNWHNGAQYSFFLTYNADLRNLRRGDFVLRTVTPNRMMTPWKDISGEWKINNGIIDAVIRMGPMEYMLTGKVGLLESDLEIQSKHPQIKLSAKWNFKIRGSNKDLYMKLGIGEKFVMWKLMGKIEKYPFDGGDIKGAFLASRFMKDEFLFTAKWKKEGGVVRGNGTYKYGNKSGTHTLKMLKRNPHERSLILKWEATTSKGPILINAQYNLRQKMVDIKITLGNQEIFLVKFILNNFSIAFSENPIAFNIPFIGQGQITIQHDFRDKLSKSVKIIGTINGRGLSYIFQWTRDNKLTMFNLKGDINSVLFGKANIDANFDIQNFNNAKGSFIYSRNNNKNIKLEWSRKKEATRLEDKMIFESHFSLLPKASVYVNADWSQGFEANAGVLANNKDIKAHLKITPTNTVATITTPFPQFGNININIDYNLQKAKSKSLTLTYRRGQNVVQMNFQLNTPNKKSGTLSLSLTTPFEVLRTFNINAEWKKGVFSAVYTRNDVTVNIEGTAEVKTNKSSFDVRFVPPNSGPVQLAFSYDLDSFVKGAGKKVKDLINVKLQINRQSVNFIVKGYRTPDHIFLEMNGGSSFEKMKEFHITLDSELNLDKREGLLNIQIGDFYYRLKNTFERLPQGFYVKSKSESSLTPLPGLIFGFGHEKNSYMVTFGYGEDREITITLKGKDNFKRGFTGTIDIPRRGIHDLEYSLNYSFNSQDEFKIILDIKLNEGKNIKAEILYNSSGVQSRLSSSLTGNHSIRVKRSLSNGHFMADIGMDNNKLTIEGDYSKNAWKKGFKIEGEILGEKVLIAGFLNLNSINDSEGKIIFQTPFKLFKDLGGNFKIKSSNGKFKGNLDLNVLYPISVNVDVDFDDRKLKGDINLKLNKLVYDIKCDYKFNNINHVLDGVIYIQTPHVALERILIESNITSLSSKMIDAHFTIDNLLHPCSLHVLLKHDMPVFSSDIGIKFGANNELKMVADYSLLDYPLFIKGFSSVYSNSKLIFNSNSEFNFNTMNDFHANHKVNFGQNSFKGLINLEAIEGTIKGKAMGVLLEDRTFEIKLDLPTHLKKALIEISYKNGEHKHALNFNLENDTSFSKYILNFTSPGFLKWSLDLTMHGELTTLKAVLQTPIGQIQFSISPERSHTENSVETKLTGDANFSYFGNELNLDLEILGNLRAGDVKIKVAGKQNYMFYGKFENIEELYSLQINVEAPFIPAKKCSIYISYDGSEKFKLSIESFIFDNINNLYIDIRSDSILFNCVSPSIPTGMVSFEGKLVLYTLPDVAFKLMFAEGNAQNTWEVDGNINLATSPTSKSVDLKIITPYKRYRKMEFGLSYTDDDLMHLVAFAKPFNLEGEVFYGMQASTINAGLKLQTGNEEFSLTKVEASIPLDNFGPEFSAYFQGNEYNIKAKAIKNDNKSEFSLHTKNIFTLMPFNIEAVEISLLTQAPYEFDALLGRKNANDVKFGMIFDSSFLFPFEKLHRSCIFGFLPTMIL